MVHCKNYIIKQKVIKVKVGSNVQSKVSQEKWKTIKSNNISYGSLYDICKLLEEEQKDLIFANDKLDNQQILVDKENNYLKIFINNDT